jgi:hypothetical protein
MIFVQAAVVNDAFARDCNRRPFDKGCNQGPGNNGGPSGAPNRPLANTMRGYQGVRASRVFAGPNQYPPASFRAYGILAFPTRATPADQKRQVMFCNEYEADLPHVSEVPIPPSQQMVTVWPLEAADQAERLNRAPRDPRGCDYAVEHYGLVVALEAMNQADLTDEEKAEGGPFLLAWSPAAEKGKKPALVLKVDLSQITEAKDAKSLFIKWRQDIERDPRTWDRGWNVELVRDKLRYWLNDYGPKIFSLVKVGG